MNVLENNEIVDINTLNNTKKFSVAHVLHNPYNPS